MPHPRNKWERFLTGKRKGEKRARGMSDTFDTYSSRWFVHTSRLLRNTTKVCSCSMCGNPRHVEWNKKDKLTLQEKRQQQRGL